MPAMKADQPVPIQSDFLRQALKGLLVCAGLMVLGFILIVVLGKFRVEYKGSVFAIKDPAYRQLPSYYNPLWSLAAALQYFALLVQPIVLFVFRKQLRIRILPWIMLAIVTLIAVFATNAFAGYDNNFNSQLDSSLPFLLSFELFLAVAFAACQCITYYLPKRAHHKARG